MRRRLFIKADRMFKKPKPGKKRLAKWPKKLVPFYADQVHSPPLHSRLLRLMPANPRFYTTQHNAECIEHYVVSAT